MVKNSNVMKIGPYGSGLGECWHEEGHNNIVQIFISHEDDEIKSLQFQYVENGELALSELHGARNGSKFDVVKLKFPKEYLTWISGQKASHNHNLCSIAFGTNHGEYGPFGKITAYNKEFKFNLGLDPQFGGFHGTADHSNVKSIGVYLKPNTTLDPAVMTVNKTDFTEVKSEQVKGEENSREKVFLKMKDEIRVENPDELGEQVI